MNIKVHSRGFKGMCESDMACRVGMVFLPNEDAAEATSRKIAEE